MRFRRLGPQTGPKKKNAEGRRTRERTGGAAPGSRPRAAATRRDQAEGEAVPAGMSQL